MLTPEKMDRLAAAFEARGIPVLSNLKPGATKQEIDALEAQLDVTLPDEFRTLYMWRNGHIEPHAENVLVFRDNQFVGLEEIPQLHAWIQEGYHPDVLGLDLDPSAIRVDLAKCVPFAHFDGAYYTLACGEHTLSTKPGIPVIGIFHDIVAAYYTLDSLVDTCIDWVEQPDYEQYSEAPNEREIVERHNPGIYEEFYRSDPNLDYDG